MNDQLNLDDAARVTANTEGPSRRGAPETSRNAAKGNAVRSGTQRAKALKELVLGGPATDAELSERTGIYLYSVAPRRVELVELRLVEDSGGRRPTARKADAVVWRATERGRDAWVTIAETGKWEGS